MSICALPYVGLATGGQELSEQRAGRAAGCPFLPRQIFHDSLDAHFGWLSDRIGFSLVQRCDIGG